VSARAERSEERACAALTPLLSSPVFSFTEYSNIVYAPHTYTKSFTIFDPIGGYAQSLNTAWREATKMRAGVLVTEFGGPTSDDGFDRLGNITQQQVRKRASQRRQEGG
jgi:hypothetical protein